MAEKQKNTKEFFTGMAIPLGLAVLLFGFCALLLTRAGEYKSLDDIIDRQVQTNGVYGSPIYQRTFYYKQLLYKRFPPEVATLGSSRVQQFRAEDFTAPFINLGSMSSIDELSDLAHALFPGHKPQVLIVGVDFWWFLADGKAAVFTRDPADIHLRLSDIFAAFGWFLHGKLGLADVGKIFAGSSPDIGVGGIAHGDGHDRAGTYFYTSTWTGKIRSNDYKFSRDLGQIRGGEKMYAWSDDIAPAQWQRFTALLDYLQQSGIKTVLFLPPVAPTVLDAMEKSGRYAYIDKLRLKLSETAAAYRMPLFDDHDIRFAGGTDCEFIDGHHGGAIIYKRILLDMSLRVPELRQRLDLAEIGRDIDKRRGQASTLDSETDFLGLGCAKPGGAPEKNM